MAYSATWDSIAEHEVPSWYHDAKLGIFVHWGLYSVPAWAPLGLDIAEKVAQDGWEELFLEQPYSEWYQNKLRLDGSSTQRHHAATYGADFAYEDFGQQLREASERVDTDAWAELAARVGAGYLVLTTKHHEGFVLWPSARTSPRRSDVFGLERDIVGEVTSAVRKHGLKAGFYYSGGLDWTFEKRPVRNYIEVYSTIVQEPEFVEYVDAHWNELMERYEPSILWNDIGAPRGQDIPALFARFYERTPDGLVNDRWSQEVPDHEPDRKEIVKPPSSRHRDYTTPEYGAFDRVMPEKWEACRGIGNSFGYNQLEGPDDHLSTEELVHLLVDIVSKNGNLLLNIGPRADGRVPDAQLQPLLGMGEWLDVNGEAIFATRPWVTAEGRTSDGLPVRFTQKEGTVYATLLGVPATRDVVIEGLRLSGDSTVRLLGGGAALPHTQGSEGLGIGLPGDVPQAPALALAISPPPTIRS